MSYSSYDSSLAYPILLLPRRSSRRPDRSLHRVGAPAICFVRNRQRRGRTTRAAVLACCSLVEWSWQISGCPITSEPVGMGCRSVRITPVMSPLHPRPRVLRWEWADPASGLVPGSMGPFGCGQKCLTKIIQLVKLRQSQNWTQV
jgi:hypothetical protein